jgi:hypothetical protein
VNRRDRLLSLSPFLKRIFKVPLIERHTEFGRHEERLNETVHVTRGALIRQTDKSGARFRVVRAAGGDAGERRRQRRIGDECRRGASGRCGRGKLIR